MKIAIGCDHGGFEHKNAISEHLKQRGFEVEDFGIYELASVDYPDIALKVCQSVAKKENELGISNGGYKYDDENFELRIITNDSLIIEDYDEVYQYLKSEGYSCIEGIYNE